MKTLLVFLLILIPFSAHAWERQQLLEAKDFAATELASHYRQPYNEVREVVKWVHLAASEHDMEPITLLAVVGVESSFDRASESRIGALGYMQVRPEIWGHLFDLTSPEENIYAGAYVLNKYLTRTGDLTEALKAYNVGITNYRLGRFPGAQQRYVRKINNFLERWEHLTL